MKLKKYTKVLKFYNSNIGFLIEVHIINKMKTLI